MVHQLSNPSPEVYGNLDLWIAYNRNPARCALRRFILRIEVGTEVPNTERIDTSGKEVILMVMTILIICQYVQVLGQNYQKWKLLLNPLRTKN